MLQTKIMSLAQSSRLKTILKLGSLAAIKACYIQLLTLSCIVGFKKLHGKISVVREDHVASLKVEIII